METFPKYEVKSKIWNGDRCSIYLKAATKCGPRIEARSTVTRARGETNVKVENETLRIAVRNLAHEYDAVANTCRNAGKHKGH